MPVHVTIRESARTSRIRLTASARDGFVVIVPPGTPHEVVEGFVLRERAWILRAEKRLSKERTLLLPEPPTLANGLPLALHLPAVNEDWGISYVAGKGRALRVRTSSASTLVVTGPVHHVARVRTALRTWLQARAEMSLLPWLRALSAETKLPYRSASVRGARSRWGSCTRTNTISLNRALLFLPYDLARAVLVHELCHTAHHDHSPRFWARVRTHDIDATTNKRALRHGWRYVPSWVERV